MKEKRSESIYLERKKDIKKDAWEESIGLNSGPKKEEEIKKMNNGEENEGNKGKSICVDKEKKTMRGCKVLVSEGRRLN